ncbi:exodeoxyribonuclease V subunit alpha [Gordonia sp. CPCC 205515]|uniref:exodeoxyribonuclease V subunit alpha n=1 Tax=Gordonia sp. CPCC 205515 TaxID=3140791 RepID=UPI003AF334D5
MSSAQRSADRLDLLCDNGFLGATDVAITRRLVRLTGAHVPDDAQLGAALAIRAVRSGSTCLALNRIPETIAGEPDLAALVPTPDVIAESLAESVLVQGSANGPLRPLVLAESVDGPLVYLRKYHQQEAIVRAVLELRGTSRPTTEDAEVAAVVDEVFGTPTGPVEEDLQRQAALMAATNWTLVVAGGPGTGKTYTVARILAVLDRLSGGTARIGLCAPTGRAAAQLQAAVSADSAAPDSVHAVTVHSLLKWYPGGRPKFGPSNKLPFDVVVVDETSMLSMTAMSKLLEALRPDTRLVLVGDPHQLASVDAGAVLADLVERAETEPAPPVITLRRGYRFGGDISRVAEAINRGDADAVVDLVTDPAIADVTLIAPDDLDRVRELVEPWGANMRDAARAGDTQEALDALDAHRVLCAHREGAWGVGGWSRRIVDWLADLPGPRAAVLDSVTRYPGQPLLVTATDRQLGTFNGDCGVVVRDATQPERADALRVVFRRGTELTALHPSRLADVIPVYAMTIHRSQGSQFDAVTVVLPPPGSELLTRELLYTAITRAKTRVQIVGDVEVLRAAVHRRVQRASGLRSPIRVLDPTGAPG